jgi:hypothetical protein
MNFLLHAHKSENNEEKRITFYLHNGSIMFLHNTGTPIYQTTQYNSEDHNMSQPDALVTA